MVLEQASLRRDRTARQAGVKGAGLPGRRDADAKHEKLWATQAQTLAYVARQSYAVSDRRSPTTPSCAHHASCATLALRPTLNASEHFLHNNLLTAHGEYTAAMAIDRTGPKRRQEHGISKHKPKWTTLPQPCLLYTSPSPRDS